MDKSSASRSKLFHFGTTILKNFSLYVLAPFFFLWLLAQPVGNAVRQSAAASFWILLAFLVIVCLNWLVYTVIHHRRPSLLVFAHGVLCLLIVTAVEHESLPADDPLTSTLAVIGGHLLLAFLLLFSLWCASRRSKAAHSTAVVIWVLLGLIFCAMAYQVIRDFEARCVSRDTWISIISMIILLLSCCLPKMLSSHRRAVSRRRKTGLAGGWIVQIVGITHLDRDDDLVTRNVARIQYMVDDILYEARAPISRFTTRRFGKAAFLGRTVPVYYDPENPADAYANRIDRHIFDEESRKSS